MYLCIGKKIKIVNENVEIGKIRKKKFILTCKFMTCNHIKHDQKTSER